MFTKRPVPRLIAMLFLTLVAAVTFVAAITALAYPAAAAIACPQCYGFERLTPTLYVEGTMPVAERAETMAAIAEARTRVAGFYGEPGSSPRILVCATDACYASIGGGGSRGMALLDIALFLSPRGASTVIAAHELAHIELHRRLGRIKTFRQAVPQWFDEGVAVVVSDDRRYLAPAGRTDRCLAASDDDLPASVGAWIRNASADGLYAKAACRVSRWMAAKGGAKAVIDLLDRVAGGEEFASIYR